MTPSQTGTGDNSRREPTTPSGRLWVGALSRMDELVRVSDARYLITTINPQMIPDTPRHIEPRHHLRLAFNDITRPADGMIAPQAAHIEQLVTFVERWNHDGALVIHCLAGISRSTAAAFITLCALNPATSEQRLARCLREASPTASPNPRLVALADDVLARDGRMVEAIDAIGLGEQTGPEGDPFSVPSLVQDVD